MWPSPSRRRTRAPALGNPISTIGDTTPTYTWQPVSGATSYRLYVSIDGGANVIDTTVSASTACTGSLCLATPTTSLAAGSYTWAVQGVNGAGSGPWASSVTIAVTTAVTLSVSPPSLAPDGLLTATWSGIGSPSSTDWIGIFAIDAADTADLGWAFTTGQASGQVTLQLPPSVPTNRSYELRLFANNTYTRLTTSGTALSVPGLSVSPASTVAGTTLLATWTNLAGPTSGDWLGLFHPSDADTATPLSSRTTTGTAADTVPVAVPANLAAGQYELRLFANGTYLRLASTTLLVSAGSELVPDVLAGTGTAVRRVVGDYPTPLIGGLPLPSRPSGADDALLWGSVAADRRLIRLPATCPLPPEEHAADERARRMHLLGAEAAPLAQDENPGPICHTPPWMPGGSPAGGARGGDPVDLATASSSSTRPTCTSTTCCR